MVGDLLFDEVRIPIPDGDRSTVSVACIDIGIRRKGKCFFFEVDCGFDEVPDIVSLPIEEGYPDYLQWIEESTRNH